MAVDENLRRRCAEELDCILRALRLNKACGAAGNAGKKGASLPKRAAMAEAARTRTQARAAASPRPSTGNVAEVLKGQSPDGALLTDIDVARLTGRALAELSELSNPGRIKSYALMHLVRGLQDLASRYRKEWAWATGERPPRQLVEFIRDTLNSADIPCPDEHNQDRLVALMVSPRQRIEPPPPS